MKDIPIPIVGLIVSFICLIFAFSKVNADDEIIGYTEHDIPVTQEEVKVRSINVDTIRSWKWIEETETLRLTLNRKRQVDVTFFNKCWDMPYATGLQFKTWGSTSFISQGDGILPVSLSNRVALYPCTIKSITEVIEEKEDGVPVLESELKRQK